MTPVLPAHIGTYALAEICGRAAHIAGYALAVIRVPDAGTLPSVL